MQPMARGLKTLTHRESFFTATCISPPGDGDWTLKDLYSQNDVGRQPNLVNQLENVLAGSHTGIRSAYAPSIAAMNARIIEPRLLKVPVLLPGGIVIHRDRQNPADGTFIEKGDCFLMSGGGCGVAVVTINDLMIVAHVSRDSLIDRERILTGRPSRIHEGVVAALAWTLKGMRLRPSRARFFSFFNLPAESFCHPYDDLVHGEYNRIMTLWAEEEYGAGVLRFADGRRDQPCLDLSMLLERQAHKAGFQKVVIGETLPLNGAYAYTRHTDKALSKKRNLVIVHRH